MKQSIWVLILGVSLIALPSCSEGGGSMTTEESAAPAAEPDQDTEATILALEQQWVDAIVNSDTDALDRLLADDFVGTSPSAHYYYKDMALEELRSGRHSVTSMDLDEASANVYGDVAIAFTSQDEVSSYAGDDMSGHYHYTNVWLRRDGGWQVVASHGSRFDQPH